MEIGAFDDCPDLVAATVGFVGNLDERESELNGRMDRRDGRFLEVIFSKYVRTALVTMINRFPEQVLVLAGSRDHGDYENIFFKRIVLGLQKLYY